MKKILFATALFLGLSAQAEKIECQINEFGVEQKITTQVSLENFNEPHGAFAQVKSQLFPEVSGFVAVMERAGRRFAVISFYNEKLQVNSSAQYELIRPDQYIQHQFIIPNEALQLTGIETLCYYN